MPAKKSVAPFQGADFLQFFYRAAIANRLSIAIWRLPGQTSPQAIVDFAGDCWPEPVSLRPQRCGFIISPFVNFGGEVSHFLSPHAVLRDGRLLYSSNDEFAEKQATFEATLQGLLQSRNGQTDGATWYVPAAPRSSTSVSKEVYLQMIANAVDNIKQADFRKVVLSRTIERKLPADFQPVDLFNRLCVGFPGAFVSLVALPEIGTWVGASPELHLTMNRQELRTVSLAGTMPTSDLDASWGDKELEEQAIVSEYIRACFQRHNMTNVVERGPETVRVGELLHLQTTFAASLESQNRPIAIDKLLHDLHPTPAVCGLPKADALHYIQQTELHEREFYCGFLGPVGFDGQSHLFVNLRCLQLRAASAILYCGGGITKDSVPEKEWLETQLKFNALLKFLELASDGRAETSFSHVIELTEEAPRQ